MNKNKSKLDSFVRYCNEHPGHRFWQALRNWAMEESGGVVRFILTAHSFSWEDNEKNGGFLGIEDTFYHE